MTYSLFDTIRKIVREELGRVRTAELAVVQDQHPHADGGDKDNFACTVALRDSGIVLKKVPVATQRIGTASIPAVGELVLVQFVGGDINAPVITGRLYNDEDRPPVNADQQAVMHLPLGAADSDAVHLELQSGDTRQLLFKLGDALEVTAKDDDPVIELSVDGGKAKVKIERDGAVTIESNGNMKFKGGEVKIEGQTIAVEAQSELKLKGSVVNIN
ncbi:MAG: phage baseplate assembly protein V [Desulfobacteraceae bacterium]|nr:phage baseplate assembly protein V [Desulfobacteraceae bacterium]